jgi:hypothetical protein
LGTTSAIALENANRVGTPAQKIVLGAAGEVGRFNGTVPSSGDVFLAARWILLEFDATFDYNIPAAVETRPNKIATLMPLGVFTYQAERMGYSFQGWFRTPERANSSVAPDLTNANMNLRETGADGIFANTGDSARTYFARWVRNQAIVVVNLGGVGSTMYLDISMFEIGNHLTYGTPTGTVRVATDEPAAVLFEANDINAVARLILPNHASMNAWAQTVGIDLTFAGWFTAPQGGSAVTDLTYQAGSTGGIWGPHGRLVIYARWN